MGLAYGLAVALVDDVGGAVGGDGHQWNAAVISLGQGWGIVEHSRARGAHHGHGVSRGKGYAQSREGCLALVDHIVKSEWPLGEGIDDGGIARARRHHDVADAPVFEVPRYIVCYVSVLLVGHG